MDTDLKHYEHFADALFYPGQDFPAYVTALYAHLEAHYPEAAGELVDFPAFAAETPLIEIQELHTRSFDVQSITTLDIGFVMFGDDYKRGALLVNLSRELRDAGVDCRNELADHLPNVLRLLARMEDTGLRDEFVERILLPALIKIVSEFSPERIERKNKVYRKHQKTIIETCERYATVFREPLAALLRVIRADFQAPEYRPPKQSLDFLGALGNEMKLEPIK